MGASVSASPFLYKSKTTPDFETGVSKFDPHEGFDGKRKERVMIATEEEMASAKLPLKYRDYCAHLYINYLACKKRKAPFFYRCHHERHEYEQCQYDDLVISMKEFERERRLLAREAEKERLERIREERDHQKEREARASH